jgi:hypothetical protein
LDQEFVHSIEGRREEDFERGLSLVGNYCVGVLQGEGWNILKCIQD